MTNPPVLAACVVLASLAPLYGGPASATTAPAGGPQSQPFGIEGPADALSALPPGAVKLEGELGRRIDLCIRNRVAAEDFAALVKPFRERKEAGEYEWRCEFWGKWYTSAALAWRYDATDPLRTILDKAAAELIATQSGDGYIGTRGDNVRLQGWDVWGRKYVLLSLLANYDLTGDAAVLAAARRHADCLLNEVGPGKASIVRLGMWSGLASSSVLEPMVLLYRRTGDNRYLDFAHYIVEEWKARRKLIEQALARKPVAAIDPPKAYEMMSCFEGLCELYRVTGDAQCLQAVRNIYESVRDSELFIVGSGSSGEKWFGGRAKQTGPINSPMETCVTVTWMKLCFQLLRSTGEPAIADELERTAFNALLAAQKSDGGWWCYFTPMGGVKRASGGQSGMKISCCVANGPRGLLLLPQAAAMTDADGPVINIYGAGSADVSLAGGGRARIDQETDYPVGDTVVLKVSADKAAEFTLKLRVPAWSERTSIEINGRAADINPAPGRYAAIRRTWQAGDTVKLKLDLRGRLVQSPGGDERWALVRGPLVLALDKRLLPTTAGPVRIKPDPDGRVALSPRPDLAGQFNLWAAFDAPCAAEDGKESAVTFCDFASAGNTWDAKSQFCVWLPQPLNPETVFAPPPPPMRGEPTTRPGDLALASRGAKAAADSEYDKEPGCAAKVIDGVVAQETGDKGKRWHSALTPHPHWVQVELPRPARVGRAIVHFAGPGGHPVDFYGETSADGRQWTKVFQEKGYADWRQCDRAFAPVQITHFRFTIQRSASAQWPDAAQISEIELLPP